MRARKDTGWREGFPRWQDWEDQSDQSDRTDPTDRTDPSVGEGCVERGSGSGGGWRA
jgi:hypothetical protein